MVLAAEPELAGLQEGPETDLILDGHQLAQIRPTGQAGRQATVTDEAAVVLTVVMCCCSSSIPPGHLPGSKTRRASRGRRVQT